MNIQMHFKNLKRTEDLSDYVEKKMTSVTQKFRLDPVSAELDLVKVGSTYVTKCRLNGCGSPVLTANDHDVFASVDSIAEKVGSALRKEKDKRIKKNKKFRSHRSFTHGIFEEELQDTELIEDLYEEDLRFYLDYPFRIRES